MQAVKSLCVVTICKYKLNTLTDVTYQMTVGGAFVYVCERGRVKDFEQRSRVYNAIMELHCIYIFRLILCTLYLRKA